MDTTLPKVIIIQEQGYYHDSILLSISLFHKPSLHP
jgi:hypothetical protein